MDKKNEIYNLIDHKMILEMKKQDQMIDFIKIFRLDESEIKFPPTYKLDTQFGYYCRKRQPSWCDRILYKTFNSLIVYSYEHFAVEKFSDHYPVLGLFEIDSRLNLKKKDQKKEKTIILSQIVVLI